MEIAIYNPIQREQPCYGDSLCEILFDYCVIDVETTGFSPEDDILLEITALRVRNNQICDTFSSLIKTAAPIPKHIQKLTGITDDMVALAPSLEEVLKNFLAFVGDDVIIGHNVTFDLRFISENTTKLFNEPFLNDYMDTLTLSRKVFREYSCHKLGYLAEVLGLPVPAHRAEADCQTTKALYDCIWHTALDRNISIFYPDQRFVGKPADILPTVTEFDETHPLYGKVCVITGKLSINRVSALQLIVNRGGIIANSVTRKTNILVVGCDCATSKYKKVQELIALGQNIEILTEKDFIALIE